ncbi:LuxR C-terminal-related transcriptional regulator [Streptomyces sp. CWNU-52B]|uniref:LuxR C-terminal-related transcriptional regulator n=1 Tax=unclassified Streptomyces TaxID=2593676 RepID=UPI0039C465F7
MGRGAFSVEDVAKELRVDSLDEGEEVVARLLDLCLVQPSSDRADQYVPMDPSAASSQLLARSELELFERQVAVSRLRDDLARMSVLFRSSRFGSQDVNSFDIVRSREAAGLLLAQAAADSSHEVLCMQSGNGWSAEDLDEVLNREVDMLDRGVNVRVLYQHAARFDTPFRACAAKLTESGAEVRTAGALFGSLFIFDCATACILLDGDGGAVVVQESSLVKFLYSCFEHVWVTAKEFDTRRSETEVISRDMKQEIVKMLISGAKDEAIARRLGVSVRTCRKHIGQVMQMFGATSRFQFGYLVKEANLDEDV